MPNYFIAYLAQKLEAGGSETIVYIDRITTLTGETITTSDFATFSRGILTVNPEADGESEFPENISFTTVDPTNLALTGAVRGLSSKSNTVVAENKRFHPSDTPVVISFGTHNIQDLLDYIDNEISSVTVGGSASTTGTAGEIIAAAGTPVYLKEDGKWWKTAGTNTATFINRPLGIAQGAAAADGLITNGVLLAGTDTNQSSLTAGGYIYLGDTAGTISTTPGTFSKIIGVARSASAFNFDPNFTTKNYKKVTSEVSSATPTINTDLANVHQLTAQAVEITSMTTNLTGNPSLWEVFVIEITATGAGDIDITWGADFANGDVYNLPASVTLSTTLRCFLVWNGTKWVIIGFA